MRDLAGQQCRDTAKKRFKVLNALFPAFIPAFFAPFKFRR